MFVSSPSPNHFHHDACGLVSETIFGYKQCVVFVFLHWLCSITLLLWEDLLLSLEARDALDDRVEEGHLVHTNATQQTPHFISRYNTRALLILAFWEQRLCLEGHLRSTILWMDHPSSACARTRTSASSSPWGSSSSWTLCFWLSRKSSSFTYFRAHKER